AGAARPIAGTPGSPPPPRARRRAGRASRSQTPRGVAKRVGHLAAQLGERRPGGASPRDEAEAKPRPREQALLAPEGLREPLPRPVPPAATPELAARGEGGRAATRSGQPQQHEGRPLDPAPPAEQPLKLAAGPQALPARQRRPAAPRDRGHATR